MLWSQIMAKVNFDDAAPQDVSPVLPPEPAPVEQPTPEPPAKPATQAKASTPPEPWFKFIFSQPRDPDVKARAASEIAEILKRTTLSDKYCCLALLEPENSINSFDLDRVYQGLRSANGKREKDVLLMLLSRGGEIEPAYQISKLCKAFARDKFIVVVPRQAKSAATLIALGADEIHMSVLGHLGPIDPQLGHLPALSVAQALERIAGLSQKFPGSAEMFAKYLQQALTVEQIGYCDRIAESAEQYAQRLLRSKNLPDHDVLRIAKELVHEYKDHGFVIDLAEAREHLGNVWVKDNTPEITACEEVYSLFSDINQWLPIINKRLLIIGQLGAANDVLVTKAEA
jgi:ClpP class serine protease